MTIINNNINNLNNNRSKVIYLRNKYHPLFYYS